MSATRPPSWVRRREKSHYPDEKPPATKPCPRQRTAPGLPQYLTLFLAGMAQYGLNKFGSAAIICRHREIWTESRIFQHL
jgi:hypothetical protein